MPPIRSQDTLRRFLRRIRIQEFSASAVLLHYDSQSSDLKPWLWPIVDNKRLPPSDFEQHSITHEFKNPCCLCAASGTGIAYTESVVCLDIGGPYTGEYVARCATGGCKYFAPLEKMYAKMGLHLKKHDVRSSLHVPRFFPSTVACQKAATAANAPEPDHMMLLQLLKLDYTLAPGLPEAEFRNKFRKCRFCERIVPRMAQKYHGCTAHRNIIDLTSDDDVSQHTINVIDLTLDD